ncbi:DUF7310 family coiled-coil domain-containing protein [Halomarina oriensis]|uniref:DUF7310 domain-containing protein n=1 Tax=Halomarina oriensis TaxID=671145 RepID=A0A6B0GNA7_9EURY|nr:hypothetical protein [Halomarina oriensis]MWG35431.1 hypothetical protein [Halomarina oriensis]
MTDRSPTADRSLADRVAAIERALTDDTDPEGHPRDDATLRTPRVTTERVEALEADLEALRASVDALRGVVDGLDRPADADHTRQGRDTSSVAPPTPTGPDGPDDALGDLFAPTGRVIPDPEPVDASTERTDASDTTPADDGPTGILARVTETL